MCKTGELISSLQTIQIPVQKYWICRRFLFIKSLVGIDSQIFSQLLGYVQRSHDNITLFRGRGSPRWPGDAAISDWDAVMGRQNWSTPRAHNIISLLTGATNIKCRWLLWSKDTTNFKLWITTKLEICIRCDHNYCSGLQIHLPAGYPLSVIAEVAATHWV